MLSTPLAADFGLGPDAAAGRGACFLLLPPSTSGMARRRRRRGAQLATILFTPHAAQVGLLLPRWNLTLPRMPPPTPVLSWTGSLHSTPPAVDFGPGSEGAAAGRAAGDISFYASRRRLWAWPGGGRRRGAQLDGEFAVYASRRRVGADFGPRPEGGGGARCLGPEFAFFPFTHRPLDARPSYARSLVPTPPKTVDQTLPP